MARARADPRRRAAFLGFTDSGLPEGDPPAAAAGGLLRAGAAGDRGAAAGAGRAGVPAARDAHLRRERRLPAPRPHQDPPGRGGGLRGGRATRTGTRAPASPGSRSSCTTSSAFHRARFTALHEEMLRRGPGVPLRGAARALGGASRGPAERRAAGDHHPGAVRRLLRASATRPCSPTRPRSTRRAPGSPARSRSSGPAWPTEDYHLARSMVDTELPEDDLFAGMRERVSL